MITLDTNFVISMAVLTSVVVGLTEVAKKVGMPSKFAPLLAVVLGVVGSTASAFFSVTATPIIFGLVIGLSAMGLYSGTKSLQSK